MLTGLKRGKKKTTTTTAAITSTSTSNTSATRLSSLSSNAAAAAALKAALEGGGGGDVAVNTTNTTTWIATDSDTMAPTYNNNNKTEQDMTVQELAARERQSNTAALFDDEVRDIFRARNKRRRKGDNNKNADSDDQVERWMAQQRHAQKDQSQQRHQQRWQARQLARSHHQERLAAQSWWWMENTTKFDAASLVSTSDAVSLVLAPVHKSWHTPDKCDAYPHFYIVPLEAVASGAACDLTVWQQVQQYQQSLRHWAAAAGKAVIFAEVVLPSKSSSSSSSTLSSSAFYQARIHAMVVPRRLHQDAPLAFQSALNELVLEHGTHQRKMLHLRQKTLPQLVPANFAYLYVEWDAGAGNVLVLEEQSANVNVDWPLDVLGGRLGLDPLRMRRRRQQQGSSEEGQTKKVEMATRVAALKNWKKYDWTLVNNQEEDEKDTAKAALS